MSTRILTPQVRLLDGDRVKIIMPSRPDTRHFFIQPELSRATAESTLADLEALRPNAADECTYTFQLRPSTPGWGLTATFTEENRELLVANLRLALDVLAAEDREHAARAAYPGAASARG